MIHVVIRECGSVVPASQEKGKWFGAQLERDISGKYGLDIENIFRSAAKTSSYQNKSASSLVKKRKLQKLYRK
jgi:hypothetical protein